MTADYENESKHVQPTYDATFKFIFGNEKRKHLTISFLNSLMGLTNNDMITDVEFVNTVTSTATVHSKFGILNIKVIDKNKKSYFIEMHRESSSNFVKRAIHYTSLAFSGFLKKGEDFGNLKPVVFIGIVKDSITQFYSSQNFKSDYVLHDKLSEHNFMADEMRYIFYELSKFNKSENQCLTVEHQWLYYLKHCGVDKNFEADNFNENVKEAYKLMYRNSLDKNTSDKLEKEIIEEYDAKAKEDSKELEGIIQCKKSSPKDLAIKMKSLGSPLEQIREITQLEENELQEIWKNNFYPIKK